MSDLRPDPPATPGPGQLALDLPHADGSAGSADQLELELSVDDDGERRVAGPGRGREAVPDEAPSAQPVEPVEPAEQPAPSSAPGGAGARRGLRYALAPRATRGQLVVGLLCLLLGLAVAVQVQQRTSADLAALPQSELLGLLMPDQAS